MTDLFARDRPNIVWLEDRDQTAEVEFSEAGKLGAQLHVRAHPIEIVQLLESEFGEHGDPRKLEEFRVAFVVDVMIAGLLDLQKLGVAHSGTKGGSNAGYVFVDRVLREDNAISRFRPVCFLSERKLTPDFVDDIKYLGERRDADGELHGPVHYINKQASSELQRFKSFLRTL